MNLAITSGSVKIPGGYRQNARHYRGVFGGEMVVFFGGKVEVIANHFFSEILYIKRGDIRLLNGK